MTTVYYTAVSLDGFIAGPGHDLGWLLALDSDPAGPMGFDGFLPDVGAVVMGANTYQWVLEHDTSPWPYPVPTWVLTHRRFPARADGDVRFVAASAPDVHAEAAAVAAGRTIWLVGGGELAGQFHDAGLLDELVVSIAPVTLGAGAPLLPRRVDLELLEVARNRDFTCARLRVRR